MAAAIPADIAQYFGFMLRAMQKLAYLYGFDDFQLNEDEINDETMNTLLLFLGVMFGVQGANAGVKKLAALAAQRVAKVLEQKALMKGAVYPVIKKIAQAVGVRMTKQIFAAGVGKAIPVVGGVIAGGLSYATFKPCAKKLRDSFQNLPLCDPATYKDDRVIDIDYKIAIEGLNLSEEDLLIASIVIPGHCNGKGKQQVLDAIPDGPTRNRALKLYCICKDMDGLDRVRFSSGVDASFLRTDYAKRMVDTATIIYHGRLARRLAESAAETKFRVERANIVDVAADATLPRRSIQKLCVERTDIDCSLSEKTPCDTR